MFVQESAPLARYHQALFSSRSRSRIRPPGPPTRYHKREVSRIRIHYLPPPGGPTPTARHHQPLLDLDPGSAPPFFPTRYHKPLFDALTAVMEPRVESFLCSDVVTTAWAMATLEHRDPPFASRLMHRGGVGWVGLMVGWVVGWVGGRLGCDDVGLGIRDAP